MKVDIDDLQLIMEIHKQYYLTEDEKVKQGLRYVLKDVLGRYLIQVKHYDPWVSEEAEKEIKKAIPGVKISGIELHDCNVKSPFPLTKVQRELFVKGNSYNKSFHLEHDPPTLKVVRSILDTESITEKEIEKTLEPYRLCFITVKENAILNERGWKSEKRPPDAYTQLNFNEKKVND